jgi:hypothetical protein
VAAVLKVIGILAVQQVLEQSTLVQVEAVQALKLLVIIFQVLVARV